MKKTASVLLAIAFLLPVSVSAGMSTSVRVSAPRISAPKVSAPKVAAPKAVPVKATAPKPTSAKSVAVASKAQDFTPSYWTFWAPNFFLWMWIFGDKDDKKTN